MFRIILNLEVITELINYCLGNNTAIKIKILKVPKIHY